MIEEFMIQIEQRELFYKKLTEIKDSEHRKALNIKDDKIAELSQSIQGLENKNRQLKEEVDNMKLQVSKGTTINNEQGNTILSICEEDYQQIIDDIQKAYIIKSQRIIEYCLDELIQNVSGYKVFIQAEDFWSIVFVAYIYNRHHEIYETYADNASVTQYKCHEQELYMKLLELSGANTEEAKFEEIIRYIRDASKDMVNIYPYIKNELLAEMSEAVEQMYQDFLIQEENKVWESNKLEEEGESLTELVEELNKSYQCDEIEGVNIPNGKVEEEGQSLTELINELLNICEEEKQPKVTQSIKQNELYSIPQINKAIKKYVDGDEWEKLKSALRYVIKHHNHYQQLFDSGTFCEYLLISYMFEYEVVFCKTFTSTKERLMQVNAAYNLHCMLETEKNMPLYTLQLNCASRAMDQGRNRNDIFKIVDGKKILTHLKKGVIPHTRQVTVMETLEKVAKDSRSTWEKYKVFVRTQEGKMILIEGWKKNITGAWFITLETYQNIKDKMNSKQIKIVGNTEARGVQSQNRDKHPSGTAYSNASSVTNVNKDTANGEISLNEKSPLKVLGYDTTKSREERWRILTQQAIPKLGKTKVVWYINFFIKLHKSKPTMASAIKEWEYDLKKLGAK